MEFSIGSIVINALAVGLCFAPFILIRNNKSKREKYYKIKLTELAESENSKISKEEIFRDFAIGIDELTHKLFFCSKRGDKEKQFKIDLSTIKSCKVERFNRTFDDKLGKHSVIEKLQLSLFHKSKTDSIIKLEFYNSNKNPQLGNELLSLNTWNELIASKLN